MRKSTMMVAVMMVLFLTMGTAYAQCCGMKKGSEKKGGAMQCPMMGNMKKADIEKMMKNCPMMKGKTPEEQKKIMSSCPMMKYMMSDKKDKKPLTKEEMQKMMTNCPMMKNMTDDEKKKMKAACPMMKCMSMMKGKGMMKGCPMMNNKGDNQKAGAAQTNCPVMTGNKINKNLYVDAEGKRIYVCCPGCIAKVKADPKKYIKELEAKGVKLEDAPKK